MLALRFRAPPPPVIRWRLLLGESLPSPQKEPGLGPTLPRPRSAEAEMENWKD